MPSADLEPDLQAALEPHWRVGSHFSGEGDSATLNEAPQNYSSHMHKHMHMHMCMCRFLIGRLSHLLLTTHCVLRTAHCAYSTHYCGPYSTHDVVGV